MNLKKIIKIRIHSIFKIFVAILMISFAGANLIISLEHNFNNEQFESLGAVFWWVLITMTIVSYSNKVPVTPAGQ